MVLDLEIRNETLHGNRLEDGVIKVQQGDTVTINLTSDVPAYFHVHGYDLLNKIEPEKLFSFSFLLMFSCGVGFSFFGVLNGFGSKSAIMFLTSSILN